VGNEHSQGHNNGVGVPKFVTNITEKFAVFLLEAESVVYKDDTGTSLKYFVVI